MYNIFENILWQGMRSFCHLGKNKVQCGNETCTHAMFCIKLHNC